MWRVCSIHINNDWAKKKEGIRQTLADFFSLMIRDKVDVVTGDFNQAHHHIGEVLMNLRKKSKIPFYWSQPGATEEIRTIMFNWPVHQDVNFRESPVQQEMWVREVTRFDAFDVTDFGLGENDHDTHCPSLFIIRKSPKISHSDLHSRSDAGKQKDKERRQKKIAERKKASPSVQQQKPAPQKK